MKTYEEIYELVTDMAKQAYGKLGWDHEQAPMFFLFKEDDTVEVMLVKDQLPTRNEAMDALARMHRELSRKGAAVLMIEMYFRENPSPEDERLTREGMSMANDPHRNEGIMINIRHGREQRVGLVKLNREHQRFTAFELIDPNDKDIKASGRFAG